MIVEPQAVHRVKEIIAEENNPNLGLRVFISGGGCAGFQYGFAFDENTESDDKVMEFDGLRVLVDAMSWPFLSEATVAYEEDINGSYFSVKNIAGASSSCSCGSSFSCG